MGVTAAQLIARVSTEGVSTSSAQLALMGGAVKATQGIFKDLGSGASLMGFGLTNLGNSGVKSGQAIFDGAAQMGGALWKVAGIAALAAAAIGVAIAVVSVKMAADFQQGVNRLRTGAGDTQDSFASLSKGILKVSTDTGVLSGPLTQAMYLILSSGQRGAQAFATLAAAAKGAVIEQANVKDVANTLSGVMTNYGTKVFGATAYMNGLIKAVSLGKITLQDLAVAMGPIDPIAHSLGVSFSDLSAAMTTQTNAMIPAHIAATGLRFLMQSLEKPTKAATSAMQEYGLNTVAVADEMRKSLPGALQMIYDAAKKAGPEGSTPFNRAVSDMVGGIRSFTAYTALTGPHMKDFIANSQAIADKMKNGKGEIAGWALVQGNFNVQMDRGKAAGAALMITIGQQLLPVMTQLFAAIVPIIVNFTNWLVSSGALKNILTVLGGTFNVLGTIVSAVATFFQKHELAMVALKTVGVILAGVIGGMMVAALVAYTIAAWTAAAATLAWAWPFLLIGAIVALVVAGIILAIQHWGQIMDWITGKTEQLRIAHEQKMVAMKIAADNHTAQMAQRSIQNLEVQRVGLLAKLKATHDPMERMELEHQLNFNAMQIKNQELRLQRAEADKQAQLKKQAELHAQMLEAQKNFAQRFLDMVGSWIGDQMSKLGTMVSGWATHLGRAKDSALSALGTLISDFLSRLGGWKDSVIAKVVQMATDFVAKIAALPGQLAGLAGQLIAAGAQIVANIATGIVGAIGNFLGNAMSQVGTFIHDHLPHSPAKRGPLRDLQLQGSLIPQQIADGITAGMPRLQGALALALRPVSVSVGTQGGQPWSFGGGPSSSYAFPGVSAQAPIVINMPPTNTYLDGRLLTNGIMPYVAMAVRSTTGAKF